MYYLLALHLLKICRRCFQNASCKSAIEQHELQSDLVNVFLALVVVCFYVGFVFFCVHSLSGFPRTVFSPCVLVTVAHMLDKNKVSRFSSW